MIYYLLVIPLVLYAYLFPKFIRKNQYFHYAIALIATIIGLVINNYTFLNEGFLSLSFFIVVMFTGVLSSSKLKKRLMSVRGIYAIIGYILVSSHAISYLQYTIDEEVFTSHIVIPIGLIIYLTFLPLFITSFKIVRKHMSYKTWKIIHRFAYLGYLLLFFHLYLLDNSRQIFYIGLFGIYTIFRIVQAIDKYSVMKKTKKVKQEALKTVT